MNSLENIEKLKALLDSGAINEEEYEEMKKQALASFGKEEEKPKKMQPTTGNFFANNYETIHIVGVCILIFTTLLSFIANMIGLYSNIKFQLITNFIVGIISKNILLRDTFAYQIIFAGCGKRNRISFPVFLMS